MKKFKTDNQLIFEAYVNRPRTFRKRFKIEDVLRGDETEDEKRMMTTLYKLAEDDTDEHKLVETPLIRVSDGFDELLACVRKNQKMSSIMQPYAQDIIRNIALLVDAMYYVGEPCIDIITQSDRCSSFFKHVLNRCANGESPTDTVQEIFDWVCLKMPNMCGEFYENMKELGKCCRDCTQFVSDNLKPRIFEGMGRKANHDYIMNLAQRHR